MSAPLLASRTDVENRLRRSLTDAEAGENDKWVNASLEEASVLVTSYCGQSFDDPVPNEVRVVTSRVAARGVTSTRTDAAASQTDQADIWSRTVAYQPDSTSGGMWLTKADKLMLAPRTTSGKPFAIDTVGTGSIHAAICSINLGGAYCSCGADIAGFPLWESTP